MQALTRKTGRTYIGMKLTSRSCVLLSIAGLFLTMGTLAARVSSGTPNTTSSMNDRRFAREAALANRENIDLGNLATQNAYDYRVKELGKRMVQDATRLNDELTGIAMNDGLMLPTALEPRQQAVVNQLANLSGPRFDREYLREMIMSHERAVNQFRSETLNGSNPDLKQWASASLPTVEDHLRIAKEDRAAIDAAQTSGIMPRK